MASRLKDDLDFEREQMLCEILPRVAGLNPDDDADGNFDIALDFCLTNLDYHRFGDTNPSEVKREFNG